MDNKDKEFLKRVKARFKHKRRILKEEILQELDSHFK